MLQHEAVRFKQIVGCSRVFPPAGYLVVAERKTMFDKILMRVGYLKLAACAWLKRIDRFKNMVVVNINSCNSERRRRLCGLFRDTDDLFAVEFGNAKPLRVRDPCKRKETIHARGVETVDKTLYAADDHIITQIKYEGLFSDELFRYLYTVGETERRPLRDIGNLHAERPFAFYSLLHFVCIFRRDDDADIGNARIVYIFQRIKQYRLIRNRNKMLVLRMGYRSQARAAPARR